MRVIVFCVLLLAALAACFVSPPDSGPPSPITQGSTLTASLGCAGCHGTDFSGGVGPNLTPDPASGLGAWSNDQIARAIRVGIDDDGVVLCNTMPRFGSLDDAAMGEVVAFLRSLPPITTDDSSVPDCDGEDAGSVDVGDGGVIIVTDDAAAPPPTCPGFAEPNTPAPCHACKTSTCQANGCFGGYFCDLALTRCEPKPSGC